MFTLEDHKEEWPLARYVTLSKFGQKWGFKHGVSQAGGYYMYSSWLRYNGLLAQLFLPWQWSCDHFLLPWKRVGTNAQHLCTRDSMSNWLSNERLCSFCLCHLFSRCYIILVTLLPICSVNKFKHYSMDMKAFYCIRRKVSLL